MQNLTASNPEQLTQMIAYGYRPEDAGPAFKLIELWDGRLVLGWVSWNNTKPYPDISVQDDFSSFNEQELAPFVSQLLQEGREIVLRAGKNTIFWS